MRFVFFYHSLVSDWNHGNAHFLRGVATELISRGHEVVVYEPKDSWSRKNLVEQHGEESLREFADAYPLLSSRRYTLNLDLEAALAGAEVVIVHEWSAPKLVKRVGEHRSRHRGYRLLFHDTHHRAVTARKQMSAYDLRHYDGVLAYGGVLRDLYLANSWTQRAWTWHEAADVRVFHPRDEIKRTRDLVWIGNWGDDERTRELHEFLIDPVAALRLDAKVHGVRYPKDAQRALATAGIEYGGWLANFRVPETFAQFRATVHVPRGPYTRQLPGIPTIRPFEALACGIPLVSAPWEDAEHLFTPGRDYLVANSGREMQKHLRALLADKAMAREIAEHGRCTILARHTCAHRVNELLAIVASL